MIKQIYGLMLFGLMAAFTSCDAPSSISKVSGTLEGPLTIDSVPSAVLERIGQAERFHMYDIMSDTASSVCVQAISEADTTPTEGYGIVVVKGATSTTFPNLRNTRAPMATYDSEHNILWLSSSAMEGTGVWVDWLHKIRFDENDKAYIACSVEPYSLQQQLCQRLGYTTTGEDITLWDDTQELVTVSSTVTDMGGFDEDEPVWIGEQISYSLTDSTPRLLVTPGVKFTTGLVLTYDDMPTLTAPLTILDDGTVSIGELTLNK